MQRLHRESVVLGKYWAVSLQVRQDVREEQVRQFGIEQAWQPRVVELMKLLRRGSQYPQVRLPKR